MSVSIHNLSAMVLKEINLQVSAGEWVMVIGHNGAGKSTLFRALLGEIEITSGSIYLGKTNISQTAIEHRAKYIATVLQDPQVSTVLELSVLDNLYLACLRGQPQSFKLLKNREQNERLSQYIKSFSGFLYENLNQTVAYLSGGQRQILALAMALLNPSELLLLDEITAALDPKMALEVMDITEKHVREKGVTTLMITHHMPFVLQYGDRLVILKEGRVSHIYTKSEKSQLTPQALAEHFV